jgi:hypothetical protein
MTTDWYRHESWNEAVEKEFFAKLARARSQRDQYLAIQALTIAKGDPQTALRLVDIYFETKKTSSDDLGALTAKANALLASNQIDLAINTMKEILAIERIKPNRKTNTYVDYPFIVATQGLSAEYADALAVLDERKSDLAFPVSKFKWHAAKALIHRALQNLDDAKQQAGLALEAAQVKNSKLRYHRGLGLVGNEYKDMVAEMQKIYA